MTTVPIWGLASTLAHGAGVVCPGASEITYSRPSGVNPPRPLKKTRSRGAGADVVAGSIDRVGDEARNLALDRRPPLDLLGQGLGAVGEDHPRDRLQQHPVFLRQLFAAPHEDPAGLVHPVRFRARGDQAHDPVLQDLPIPGEILVQDDQIGFQSFLAPVGVGLEDLFHQIDPVHVGDAHQDDRQVARDPEAPTGRTGRAGCG